MLLEGRKESSSLMKRQHSRSSLDREMGHAAAGIVGHGPPKLFF